MTMTALSNLQAGNSARKAFSAGVALAVFVSLEALVALQAWLAYQDHFLTVSQMQARGVHLGLPFAWHFGMWGDVFIVSPLAAYVTGRFSSTWRLRWIVLSLALGVAAAIAMSWSYTLSDLQEAHVQSHSLTSAGAVHLVYMALVLAAFTQFLFFTEDVSSRLLRVASVLLVIHVFLGTHMALGLLHLIIPLDWYPAQPLKSIIGWSIIAAVTSGLIWRNVGNARLYNALVLAYMFLTSEDPRPLEGHLKFLNRISDLSISVTYFFKLFWTGLDSGGERLSLGLLLMVAIRYYFSRVSVKQELEIGKSLYPPGRVPDGVLLPKTLDEIRFRVLGFLILYAILGSISGHIFWASLILTVIACNDYRTRFDISSNILRTFDDPRYQPSKNESGYQTIMDKRKVARWYLSELPTRTKEALCAIGCATACGIAAYGYFSNINLDIASYFTLIGTLALNELVTLWWRIKRFRLLLAIDRRRK
ncbi:MAG: hypothetical protein WBP94_08125 [Rhodomicrobiaceae bacterium]